MDDTTLLRLVRDERSRSIGFENDATLTSEREQSLAYYNGEVDDLDALEGTSTAVSSDVADAIETVLPDLVEVFTTEEVAAFVPTSEEDVAQAEQETDYVNHVVLSDNNGFVLFGDMFKDALQLKVGVVMAQWEAPKEPETEEFVGGAQDVVQAIIASRQSGATVKPTDQEGDQITYTITAPPSQGRVKITPVAPEDFTVSADTVKLSESPYCAFRTRVRRASLIADGYDADDVEELEAYGFAYDGEIAQERSTAGEQDPGTEGATKEADLVEVVHHFIRQYEGPREVIYKVVTGNREAVLLGRETVNAIPFAAVTPFRVTHRFYGQSLGDKLIEIQRIKTSILRLMLNSGYFAQNQRMQVGEAALGAHTLKDLMDNRPGQPIRVKAVGELAPVPSAGLAFDAFQALEYTSAMGEQRSGVVRNAQGLNPDSLHETASGMAALHAAALKRVRYIARMFAETGVKDLFLLVHDLLRTHSSQARLVRMRGKFVQVDPTKWASRDTMSIEIGVGAGGREHDIMMLGQVLQQQQAAVQAGGLQSGLITPKNIYNAATKWASRAGFKAPEMFWNDPATMPPQPPAPNPEMAKVQAQQAADAARLQFDQQKAQLDSQHRDADRQTDMQLKMKEIDLKGQIAVFDAQTRVALAQEELRIKYGAQADQVAQEINLKGEIAAAQAQLDAARLGMEDRHHVEDHLAGAMLATHLQDMKLVGLTHIAGLQHVAAMRPITGGDVRPGGEPG